MPVSLLDVNVLLALGWPNHLHHAAAHRWFAESHLQGWATCPLTQLGFARLSMQPAVVKTPLVFADVLEALSRMMGNPLHIFWALDVGLAGMDEMIRAQLVGHHQLTDAVLLDLAIRHRGRLATFDRKAVSLVPANVKPHEVLEVIAT